MLPVSQLEGLHGGEDRWRPHVLSDVVHLSCIPTGTLLQLQQAKEFGTSTCRQTIAGQTDTDERKLC